MSTRASPPPNERAKGLLRKLVAEKFTATQFDEVCDILVVDASRRSGKNKSERAGNAIRAMSGEQLADLVDMVMGYGFVQPGATPDALIEAERELREACGITPTREAVPSRSKIRSLFPGKADVSPTAERRIEPVPLPHRESLTSGQVRVFVSYSHDSESHRAQVLKLAQTLRSRWGIDARIDRFEQNPPEGWPRWMQRQVEDAGFVLAVCSDAYKLRFEGKEQPGRGLGANWEGFLTSNLIYDNSALNDKVVPVLFGDERDDCVPLVLRSATRYRIPNDLISLVRHLTGQPEVVPAPLAGSVTLPPLDNGSSLPSGNALSGASATLSGDGGTGGLHSGNESSRPTRMNALGGGGVGGGGTVMTTAGHVVRTMRPEDSPAFFHDRICDAFPGLRGVHHFQSAQRAADRLEALLKAPLCVGGYPPIWEFDGRGGMHIERFLRLGAETVRIGVHRYRLRDLWVYRSDTYWRSFVVVRYEGEAPCGLYPPPANSVWASFPEVTEEYGVWNGRLITRHEFDDGGVMEGDVVVRTEGAELEVRHLSSWARVIAAQFSPLQHSGFDRELQGWIKDIVNGHRSVELLAARVEELFPHPRLG